MRKILILGAGAGGTIVANMLRKQLSEAEWQITIIDKDERHHYQAGYLFIPFGVYSEGDVLKAKKDFIPQGSAGWWFSAFRADRSQLPVSWSACACFLTWPM